MATAPERRRVAIACQGGGSHTAFTAGVLKRLLRTEELGGYEIVGLSGTSGGAICALLAWAALRDDDPGRAGELLDRFWTDNSATTPVERWVNAWTLGASALLDVAVPLVSPYLSAASSESLEQLRQLLLRQLDFDELDTPSDRGPMLLIGAVDVLSGDFKAFNSRRDRVTPDVILASAAIPTLFRAVPVDGRLYWDGLFSQNPPVRELVDAQPDEIWVIQINAKQFASEPQSSRDIADRRNELSGNLSLYQELHVIEKIDQLLEEGLLASGGRFRPIVVRIIELVRSRMSRSLGTTSKLNRDVDFIRELMAHGSDRAEEFLAARAFEDAWRARDVDAVLGFFAADADVVSAAPFPERTVERDAAALRAFVRQQLDADVLPDLTRKQVAGDTVTWMLRARPAENQDAVRGRADVRFRDGKISYLSLGTSP